MSEQYKMDMYWLQSQAPSGNWYDSIFSYELESLEDSFEVMKSRNQPCRIIARCYYTVKEFTK